MARHDVKNEQLQHALQSLFEQGRDPMFIADEDGNITHANPAFHQLYQYSAADISNMDSFRLWQDSFHDEAYYQNFLETMKVEKHWAGELHIASKSGEIIPVWTQIIAVDDCFAITQVDLRERDKVTRKMEQFSRLQSLATLAGGVAHEFNNILGGIQGHLYLFKRQLQAITDKDKDRFLRIDTLMTRASVLVQNLLAFSKQKPTTVSEVNLQRLLQETVSMCKKSVDAGITLTLHTANEAIVVQADAVVLKQHIFELISNAQSAILRQRVQKNKYGDDEKICIELRLASPDMAEILVQDNGEGMQDAVLHHCLDPFFTTEPVGKGTGLGLSSALSYVEQLQGSLEVESVLGEYTKVRILLPLQIEPAQILTEKGCVLLIDDEPDLRDSIEEILVYHGYKVITASNGVEGLDIWRAQQTDIDAIVMDIVMPNMNGIEMATALRKENPTLPICLTTGYSQQVVPEHLHVNLIRKPLSPDLLLEFLEATIPK
ncbi:hybrid sensor histidine kinase/response regulator [Ghiorsea bivora]|uniref:hybrid sensor histidine kinase/response regulator n=1 Tax=Ghiorsea bivora TaxID=1485545 RepID=UPI000571A9EF|nr:response regulator [Ghiorsea bivora]